jgi:hypothetical protein
MRTSWLLLGLLVGCVAAPSHVTKTDPDPGLRLHGHNDYLQPVPCKRALELGLGALEADIYLVDGELRVGHEVWQLRPGRTLQSLYLEPLRTAFLANGCLRADGQPLVLLVDIKADGSDVYRALREVLRGYGEMLTRFANGRVEPGAVTVLLSGNRPLQLIAGDNDRWCALDGRFRDLDTEPMVPVDLMPWVSGSWRSISDWTGSDELLHDELLRIHALVAKAHQQGRAVRFWAAPDRREAWAALFDLGVDYICTDQPKNAAKWLRAHRSPNSARSH